MPGFSQSTEAAVIAVVYGILLGFFYKSITKELPSVIRQTLDVTVGVTVILLIASALHAVFVDPYIFTDTPDRGGIPDESDG